MRVACKASFGQSYRGQWVPESLVKFGKIGPGTQSDIQSGVCWEHIYIPGMGPVISCNALIGLDEPMSLRCVRHANFDVFLLYLTR
jgi:hypothetical protein